MKKITTFLLALLLVIPAMAHNLAANSKMYFEKPSTWSAAQFMIGHSGWSEGYLMSKISNTNLYYISMAQWDGYTQWIVFDQSGKWGGENNSITHRANYMGSNKTTIGTSALGTCNLINTNGTFTALSSYSSLNHTQTIAIEGEGTTAISTYKLNGDNTSTTSTGTTSADAAYTATVKCTATAADGYQFVGWYDGSTLLSTNATYSYTAANAAKTITARFEQLAAETPVISNFAASATSVATGDVVTFSCDVENGDVANVVYLVNGEAIVGNEWTPTEAGEYTISATLEGALTQTLTVTVYVKPAIEAGEMAVFFDNTNSNWATPTVWAWGDFGNCSASWPGEAMTYLGNNMWKWSYGGAEMPTKVIFSNNGANQTDNLDWVNGGVYSTASKTPSQVILPEGLNIQLTIPTTVYVGDEVTLTSVYTEGYTVKYLVNGVENGETWTPTAAGEYTIAANLMNGSDVVAFDEKVVTVKEHTVFYAYLLKEGAWATTYIYYWGDAENTWPGTALSETETIDGNEYYKYAFNDVTTVNIIFNNNSGAQTSNIENVTATAYYRITNQAGGEGSHEASATPFEGAAEPTLFIRGTMNSWEATDPMTYENGVFTWTGEIKGGDEFKFDVDGNWTTSYGYSEVTFADEYTVSASASDDNILWTGLDSNVTITVSGDYKTVTIVVNEVTEEPETLVFTVTVPAGTENCYIIGNFAGSDWATPVVMEKVTDLQYTISIEGLYRSTVKYKYLTNAEENLAAGDLWKNEEVADAEDNHVDSRNYNEEDVVVKWKGIAVYYPENIVCEQNYYLDTNNLWNTDEAWFAAYFFNKNTDAHTWVAGELLSTGYYLFYLSQYNVPAAAPARAKAEEAPVYTHVIFTRMNPAYSVLDWDLTEEVDNGNGSTTTNVLEDRVWNQTADLAYDGGEARTYQITTADGEGNWISLPTGLEAVKADGMVYAGNVVSAEGAIEVYNLSGAVVAYGENRVDLNGLAGGVYVVRCGNDVMKVVR